MDKRDNVADQVNELIDDMETGTLSRRQLFVQLTALGVMATGLGGLVRPAKAGLTTTTKSDLVPTGILIRVDDRAGASFGRVEGIVRPGAAKLTQLDSSGFWRFTVTKGTASADVDGTPRNAQVGGIIDVPATKPITYSNPGTKEWRFVAELQPAWRPSTISYRLGNGKYIKGSNLWFELKNSAADSISRPRYLVQDWNEVAKRDGHDVEITPAWSEVAGDACVVEAQAAFAEGIESTTFAEKHLTMDRVFTVISGAGQVIRDGVATNVRRGDTGTVPAGVAVKWSGSSSNLLAEMRPVRPGLWVPEHTSWEMSPGNFVAGNKIWFEMVMPSEKATSDRSRAER